MIRRPLSGTNLSLSSFGSVIAFSSYFAVEITRIGSVVRASSDTFYPGQERYDTFSGRVVKRFQGSMQEWQDMGVLNFEMESATLLTMCASSGLKAGCVAGVIINRTQKETPDHDTLKVTEARSIKVVVEAARKML